MTSLSTPTGIAAALLHDRRAAEMPLLIDFATDLIRAGAGGLYQATESRRRPTRDVPMLEIEFMNSRAISIEP